MRSNPTRITASWDQVGDASSAAGLMPVMRSFRTLAEPRADPRADPRAFQLLVEMG